MVFWLLLCRWLLLFAGDSGGEPQPFPVELVPPFLPSRGTLPGDRLLRSLPWIPVAPVAHRWAAAPGGSRRASGSRRTGRSGRSGRAVCAWGYHYFTGRAAPGGSGYAGHALGVRLGLGAGGSATMPAPMRPIRLPPISVNQTLPSGPAVIPYGWLPAVMPVGTSVTAPVGVIRGLIQLPSISVETRGHHLQPGRSPKMVKSRR